MVIALKRKKKDMKIYCELCKKVQPVRIDNCRDAKTNEPYQDIVCVECDFVIASGTGIAQPEQEPVAWMNNDYEVFFDAGKAACYSMGWIKPLYTAPPKREWVGLTMQEYVEIENNVAAHYAPNNVPRSVRVFAQVLWETIEAKLKEKNT